jgi:hypothetical protein
MERVSRRGVTARCIGATARCGDASPAGSDASGIRGARVRGGGVPGGCLCPRSHPPRATQTGGSRADRVGTCAGRLGTRADRHKATAARAGRSGYLPCTRARRRAKRHRVIAAAATAAAAAAATGMALHLAGPCPVRRRLWRRRR